jgi:hypothetical protein
MAAAAIALAALLVVSLWPTTLAMQLTAGRPEKTEMQTENEEEVLAIPVTISVPGKWPEPNSAVFFEPGSAKAEARVVGASNGWIEVHCTLPVDHVSAGWSAEGTVLVPASAEAIRLKLRCTGRTLPWRTAGFLSKWGVQPSPKMERKLGPPAGRKPRWKEVIVEAAIPAIKAAERQGSKKQILDSVKGPCTPINRAAAVYLEALRLGQFQAFDLAAPFRQLSSAPAGGVPSIRSPSEQRPFA